MASCGKPSPENCRRLLSLLCGKGSGRMPGRSPGGGVLCARRPTCVTCSSTSLALAPVFGPRGTVWCENSAKAMATLRRSWRKNCLSRRCRLRAAPVALSTSIVNSVKLFAEVTHKKMGTLAGKRFIVVVCLFVCCCLCCCVVCWCVVVCCCVLLCVVVCCGVLWCVVVCCGVLWCVVCCCVLLCVVVCCCVLLRVLACCYVLLRVVVLCCCVLLCVVVCCCVLLRVVVCCCCVGVVLVLCWCCVVVVVVVLLCCCLLCCCLLFVVCCLLFVCCLFVCCVFVVLLLCCCCCGCLRHNRDVRMTTTSYLAKRPANWETCSLEAWTAYPGNYPTPVLS